jgi:hypothetical protein
MLPSRFAVHTYYEKAQHLVVVYRAPLRFSSMGTTRYGRCVWLRHCGFDSPFCARLCFFPANGAMVGKAPGSEAVRRDRCVQKRIANALYGLGGWLGRLDRRTAQEVHPSVVGRDDKSYVANVLNSGDIDPSASL